MEEMTKRKFYGFLACALVLSFGVGTFTGYMMSGTTTEIEKIQVESPAVSYKFYLAEDNGMVTVYRTSNGEIYEYTDISMQELPEDVREEVYQQKYMTDEEELYSFLESYTS